MALTVTPGGAADDSLVSLADFETHCAAFGHDVSAFSDAQKEAVLRKATLWVEGIGARGKTISYRWPGTKASAAQARVWPRAGATAADGTALDPATIPWAVEQAVCEAAVYELANDGALFGALTLSQVVTGEAVGPIKVTYRVPDDLDDARPMLAIVNDILSSILVAEQKGGNFLFAATGNGDTSWE